MLVTALSLYARIDAPLVFGPTDPRGNPVAPAGRSAGGITRVEQARDAARRFAEAACARAVA